jgi:hypothetical protein
VIVFIGMETSGAFRRRFQALGHHVVSCDLLPAEDGAGYDPSTGGHVVGDVFQTLDDLWAAGRWPDLAIFHPTCTYLTGSGEWAYKDPDFVRYPGVGYHQKPKPETLVGVERRQAREEALNGVRRIIALPIARKVIENPVGVIGTRIRKPTQTVQPNQFGDDASKRTCLWYFGNDGAALRDMIVPLDPTLQVPPRMVDGRPRWANQSPCGAFKAGPSADRWKDRSRTYAGIADACTAHWASLPPQPTLL